MRTLEELRAELRAPEDWAGVVVMEMPLATRSTSPVSPPVPPETFLVEYDGHRTAVSKAEFFLLQDRGAKLMPFVPFGDRTPTH